MEHGKRMLEEKDFDAVILDLGLPDAAGGVGRQLQRQRPGHADVVLTGQEKWNTQLGAAGVSAGNFLPKSE